MPPTPNAPLSLTNTAWLPLLSPKTPGKNRKQDGIEGSTPRPAELNENPSLRIRENTAARLPRGLAAEHEQLRGDRSAERDVAHLPREGSAARQRDGRAEGRVEPP